MKCAICGLDDHGFKCPLIKAYEYHQELGEDGSARISRVEFVTYADIQPQQPILNLLPAHGTRQ